MNFISNCLKGIAIGAGAILPGISSGVICIIFGIYEKLLDSILNFFKDIKGNFEFLFPIIIGVSIGVILFGNLLNHFFYQFPLQTKSLFIGLILGCIPLLIKEINKRKKIKLKNIFFLFLALSIGILSVIIEKNLSFSSINNINFIYLVLSGFLMSIGVVLPGVSSTLILMILGIYPIYLTSISNVYLPILVPMGIGLILGGFIFMKLTKYLLNNYYISTFLAIIGFTLGSILVLIPTFTSLIEIIISLFCIILGFCISTWFEK